MRLLFLGPRAVLRALRHPGLLLLLWLVVTVPAVVAVAPYAAGAVETLGRHGDAGSLWSPALDADFERLHAGLLPPVLGGAIFVVLAWTLLSGGILAAAGTGERVRLREVLGEGGRFFFRNLRLVLLLGLALLAWSWAYEHGRGFLERWLRPEGNPWVVFGWRHVLDLAYGLGVLGLAWHAKVALADLVARDGRSALLAWVRGAGFVLRHPLRSVSSVGGITFLAVAVLFALGEVLSRLLEGRGELGAALAVGQAGILFLQACAVAMLLAAHDLLAPLHPARVAPAVSEAST